MDANWPMWDKKKRSMARLIGDIVLAIAIWACADITLGILGKFVL